MYPNRKTITKIAAKTNVLPRFTRKIIGVEKNKKKDTSSLFPIFKFLHIIANMIKMQNIKQRTNNISPSCVPRSAKMLSFVPLMSNGINVSRAFIIRIESGGYCRFMFKYALLSELVANTSKKSVK